VKLSIPDRRLLLGGLLFILPGCGNDDGLNLAAVRGKVLSEGKPAAAGFIVFEPDTARQNTGPVAMSRILDDGSYTLSTKLSGDGATIGPNRVGIVVIDPKPIKEESERAKMDIIVTKGETIRRVREGLKDGPVFRDRGNVYRLLSPEKLKSPTTSGIAVEVAAGSNTFDFAIRSDGSVDVTK
jgi:hypothetical protein